MTDWDSLALWALGCVQGFIAGWLLWRKPKLTYKDEE